MMRDDSVRRARANRIGVFGQAEWKHAGLGPGDFGPETTRCGDPTKKSFAVAIAVAAKGAATHDGVVNASSGPPQHDPSRPARQALADVWLDSRPALVRFLTARTGSSAAAEDLAQDVWVRLQSMTEEAVAEVRHPQAFLYRIAANLALDVSRRSAARARAIWNGDALPLSMMRPKPRMRRRPRTLSGPG